MARLYRDFMRGALTSGISNSDTTITSAAFANLPTVSGSDTFDLVLDPDGLAGDPEIVTVTAHGASSTSVTVTRGVNSSVAGTSAARSHATATLWAGGLRSQDINNMDVATALAQATADAALPAAGGTISGNLSVAGTTSVSAPTNDAHASTKKYVDDEVTAIKPYKDEHWFRGTNSITMGVTGYSGLQSNPIVFINNPNWYTAPAGGCRLQLWARGNLGFSIRDIEWVIQAREEGSGTELVTYVSGVTQHAPNGYYTSAGFFCQRDYVEGEVVEWDIAMWFKDIAADANSNIYGNVSQYARVVPIESWQGDPSTIIANYL